MKTKNKDNRSARRALATIAALIVITAIVTAVVLAFNKLRALWIEQCEITDINAQVEITTGDSIKPDAVRELFGLRNGANLATVDFAAKRQEAMKRHPVIKSISISRRLPDGVSITVVERTPFARVGLSGSKNAGGRVCDDEGVVFNCRRGVEMLPIIREAGAPGTTPGGRLEERARAALAVLLVAREAPFADFNILEIDTAKPDYLLITLANYSAVKFRWTDMDAFTPESDGYLREQLRKTAQVLATNISGEVKVWNATIQGTVTASSNRPN